MHRYRHSIIVFTAALALSTAAAADEDPRTIAVNGQATVSVKPDIARINMSVMERNPSLRAAQKQAADVTGRVLDLLDTLDVDRKYVNTTGASVQPNYRWNKVREEQELIGYIVQRNIVVELKQLDKLGELMEGAVATGVNQVSPPVLDTSERDEAHRDALAKAAEDARANAVTLTGALGAKLGGVRTINAGNMAGPPQPMMRMRADMAMAEGGAAETYNAGDINFTANVSVVFDLLAE